MPEAARSHARRLEVQRSNELKERAVELGKRRPTIGLLFGGFLVMFWGFLEASLTRQLRRNGSTAEGTVLRNVRSTRPAWITASMAVAR